VPAGNAGESLRPAKQRRNSPASSLSLDLKLAHAAWPKLKLAAARELLLLSARPTQGSHSKNTATDSLVARQDNPR
jgi:hypothetical protein